MSAALGLSLIPLLQAMFTYGGVGAALKAVTFAQWATIAVQAASDGPNAFKFLKGLHPAFSTFVADLEKDLPGHVAAANFRALLASNADEAIERMPGIGYDT